MGVAKQIPQLQPKAKRERTEKKNADGGYISTDADASPCPRSIRGSARTLARIHADVRGLAPTLAGVCGSVQTRWRGSLEFRRERESGRERE
jgi:hypothetical protein